MRDRIPAPLKRAMLNFCGYPISELPHKVTELDDMLAFVNKTKPAEYKQAHDLIVKHIIPDGAVPDELLFEKVGKLLDSEIRSSVVNNIDALQKVYVSAEARLTGAAKIAFEKAKAEAAENMRVIHVKVGNKKAKKVDGVVPEYYEKLLKKMQARINVMLVGPAGSGKTHVAGMAAESLGLDFASQSCTAGMSESALSGWLIPTGENGKFEYIQSEFVRIYENGGVFLFDEMDAADPNVIIFINQAIANGKFSLPIRHENPTVRAHKDFVAIAATNTFGGGADAMYHARNALDAATIDRFKVGMMAIDYSKAVEEQLVDPEILRWGRAVRDSIKTHKLRRLMSTRVMLDMTKLKTEQDFELSELADDYFLDWSPEEKRMFGDLTIGIISEAA